MKDFGENIQFKMRECEKCKKKKERLIWNYNDREAWLVKMSTGRYNVVLKHTHKQAYTHTHTHFYIDRMDEALQATFYPLFEEASFHLYIIWIRTAMSMILLIPYSSWKWGIFNDTVVPRFYLCLYTDCIETGIIMYKVNICCLTKLKNKKNEFSYFWFVIWTNWWYFFLFLVSICPTKNTRTYSSQLES